MQITTAYMFGTHHMFTLIKMTETCNHVTCYSSDRYDEKNCFHVNFHINEALSPFIILNT